MARRTRELFATIQTEGGLLPPELLKRIADGDRELPGLAPEAYHLEKTERIGEAINRAWNRVRGAWEAFREVRAKLGEGAPDAALTRDRWLLVLFQELGYGRLPAARGIEIDGERYPVSHAWHHTPIHLVGYRTELDRRTPGVAGAARRSPHSLVQELLNRSVEHQWGFLSNGLRLRLLRDNASLTRQAFVEFDLEAMLEGEVYADFALLFLLCHQSRVEAERPDSCWLEQWVAAARDQGTRALEHLRGGVQAAIEALGHGFLAHPRNAALRETLRNGALDKQEYYRELLRLVYRLLFLLVAEDRGLLLDPDAKLDAKRRYLDHYSTARLRRLASRRRGGPHPDLWRSLRLVMGKLGDDAGCPDLALPPLGSFLWSSAAVPHLADAELANEHLLAAVRGLAFTEQERLLRPVDWRNLDTEELGSVYESLLELHPEVDAGAPAFSLSTAAGHERKTTGSYYTPDSLVQCLLDTALDPVLDEAAKKPDPESALLALTVCDPACGSGHFLIAAARRMARRLAQVRTGDAEPDPGGLQHALRDVIGKCMYGVDVNPMAVELCKVSLWLEAIEPGRPLSYLDHQIQCGNSLLGTTPALLAKGIPDDAFEPVEGDDKKVASALKKRNKAERQAARQETMFGSFVRDEGAEYGSLADQAASLRNLADDTIAALHRKEDAFARLSASVAYARERLLADAWCAAFVWPKRAGAPDAPTSEVFRRLGEDPAKVSAVTHVEIERLAAGYRFFHWHLAFPEVFGGGELAGAKGERGSSGFDVVLSNPPWERVKLQEEEFFASRDTEIATAKNAAARKRLIARLPDTNPDLAAEWASALRVAAATSSFLRRSGRYPLGGVGDVNTYAVFADLFRQSINPRGAAGLILPNGLVTGFTYRAFLRTLLESRTLASFYGFENEDRIFPDVHNETKFGILTIRGGERPVERPWFTAHIRQPSEVYDPARRYSLRAEQIEAINPNTLNVPAFRWAADAEVAAVIHEAAPILVRKYDDDRTENPWRLRFLTMFHMANDSGLFLDHAEVEPHIAGRREALATLDDGREVYPLYEGKMLWHFDHRYGTYEGQTERQANKGVLPHVADAAHSDPQYRVQPRYWVPADDVVSALGEDASREWFFAWRDVGPTERTFVGAILPATAAGHKAPILLSALDARAVAALVGVLSSVVVDYDARQRSNQMAFFVVEQLAVPTPKTLAEHCAWLGASVRDWLADRVHELSYTNMELAPFARDLGNSRPPFRWRPDRRLILQAEIDAAVFHLYGLRRPHAEWVLDSFTVLRKYEEREVSEFRTRRLVLEIYDALQEAIDKGQPYATRLDPPPADPRIAHPPRRGA